MSEIVLGIYTQPADEHFVQQPAEATSTVIDQPASGGTQTHQAERRQEEEGEEEEEGVPSVHREEEEEEETVDDALAMEVLLGIADITGSPLARVVDARRASGGGGTEAMDAAWGLAAQGVSAMRIVSLIEACRAVTL